LVQQDASNKHIDINVDTEGNICPAWIDPDRFTQCLLNLYLNAIQAMENGGSLTVKSAAGEAKKVNIVVSDTGRGISPEQIKKIFDPYYTTKSKGTGLGLAIVQKIIEAHGGKIEVNSAIDKGTSFLISIPCEPIETFEVQNGKAKND
jgi:two-component system sensor histidine kinase HydH